MRDIKESLASLKAEATLGTKIPSITPVVDLFHQALTKLDVSVGLLSKLQFILSVHQQMVERSMDSPVVTDTFRKAAVMLSDVGGMCKRSQLEESDLPDSLDTIFRSLKRYVIRSCYPVAC
jgi:hypothetical protein